MPIIPSKLQLKVQKSLKARRFETSFFSGEANNYFFSLSYKTVEGT